ncbi:MAG: putative phage protein [Streptosporangiaceae bacterium]|nr:putative phage protein [Streptosporangiaceae bacterium]
MTTLVVADPISRGPAWFKLDRHDVRSTVPAAVRAMMQNGILDRVFQEALVPEFIFPAIADSEPWTSGMGDTKTFTRKGLLTPSTVAVTGSDVSAATYGIEQWSVTMDQYGQAVDTNMLISSMSLASKYLADVQTLGINAGQSLNRISRDKLYKAYAGGRTWCTTAGSSDTSIIVQSTDGFESVMVNGVLTPVSGANPLTVSIAGVANTVTGVNTSTKALTLGTTRVDVAGEYVVSANAPFTLRPGTARNSGYDLTTSDLVTFKLFRSAVARLRKMNVPTIGGYYVAHIDPDTEAQLFDDADFKQALQGRVDSPIYRDLSIGRFGGIDWVRNNEVPTYSGGSGGAVTVHRPIVVGGGALVAAPFEAIGTLLTGTGVEDVPDIAMVNAAPGVDVARIVRPPQDRLQQVLSTSWSWVGDYGVPSDLQTGDAALYKRGVIVEHYA